MNNKQEKKEAEKEEEEEKQEDKKKDGEEEEENSSSQQEAEDHFDRHSADGGAAAPKGEEDLDKWEEEHSEPVYGDLEILDIDLDWERKALITVPANNGGVRTYDIDDFDAHWSEPDVLWDRMAEWVHDMKNTRYLLTEMEENDDIHKIRFKHGDKWKSIRELNAISVASYFVEKNKRAKTE